MKKEIEITQDNVPDPNKWTEKQLSTVRRDCVQIAVEVYKANDKVELLALTNDIFNYVMNGNLPKAGGWK